MSKNHHEKNIFEPLVGSMGFSLRMVSGSNFRWCNTWVGSASRNPQPAHNVNVPVITLEACDLPHRRLHSRSL